VQVRFGVLEREAGQGDLVAVKSIRKASASSLNQVEQIRNELVAMRAIAKATLPLTQHLASLVAVRFSETHIHLVQQWGGADLASLMLAYERAAAIGRTNTAVHAAMPAPLAASILAGLAAALDACRTLGWVHGDIKPENLLLGNDVKTIFGAGAKAIHVRLCDFGRSRRHDDRVARGAPYCALGFTAPELYLAENLQDAALSREHEQADGEFSLSALTLAEDVTTAAADVWSAGATLLEMLIGHDRFESIWISAYRQTRSTSETYERLVRPLQRARLMAEQLVLFPITAAAAGAAARTTRTAVSPLVVCLTSMTKQCLNVDHTKRVSCSELLQFAVRASSGFSEADDGDLPCPEPARVFLRRHHFEVDDDRTAFTLNTALSPTLITMRSPEPEVDPFEGRPECGPDVFGQRHSTQHSSTAMKPDDSATTEESPASVFGILPDDVQLPLPPPSRPLTASAAVLSNASARIAALSASERRAR
jgi:serine/threonine protein kinase